MSQKPPSIDGQVTKRRKTPAAIRKPQILALQSHGLTQEEIAATFGVSRKTINRDIEELRPVIEETNARLNELSSEINAILPLKERAGKYADLAINAKNEAVSLATLQRIDDLDGIVTRKELVRTRRDEESQPAPMFTLAPGASVNVTVNQVQQAQPTASCSSDPTIEVTPISKSSDPE